MESWRRAKSQTGDPGAIVAITIVSGLNHLHSDYGQLAYANALSAAKESGTITEGIKSFADFEKAVKAKKINYKLMAKIRDKAEAATLPLGQEQRSLSQKLSNQGG
ncbi:MAG: hypothetical protein H8E24_14545 [Verrucomicrobia bacterium]|jgi:hypothetical protein|nr:hypothetical protein [Verrucomicrobiota bacterium]